MHLHVYTFLKTGNTFKGGYPPPPPKGPFISWALWKICKCNKTCKYVTWQLFNARSDCCGQQQVDADFFDLTFLLLWFAPRTLINYLHRDITTCRAVCSHNVWATNCHLCPWENFWVCFVSYTSYLMAPEVTKLLILKHSAQCKVQKDNAMIVFLTTEYCQKRQKLINIKT